MSNVKWTAVAGLLATNAAYSQAVNVSPTTINTVEGGMAASYELVLSQAPSVGETVTVTPASADVTEGAVSGAVMFTDANWDMPQTITITPGGREANDGDVGYTIGNTVTSIGGTTDFAGVLASNVMVTNQNIDGVATITVEPSSGAALSIDEGSALNVTVAVGPDVTPATDVTVGLSTTSTEVMLSATSVTLTAGNGFSATFSITAVADSVVDADRAFTIVTAASTSADAAFNGFDPVDISGVAVNVDVPLPPTRILVNTLADVTADDGQCSLREAIIAVNTSTVSGGMVGECEAGNGSGIIEFDSSLTFPGTIMLTDGQLEIRSDLMILGPGADQLPTFLFEDQLTIDAGGSSRVMRINDDDNTNIINVTLDALTLANGSASGSGGGIFNTENLSIRNSHILGSTAGFSGGGISSSNDFLSDGGSLELINSTLSGNSAPSGGGLFARVDTTLINSTISGNSALSQGGGVEIRDGDAVIVNSTFFANSAAIGSGIYLGAASTTELSNSVIGNSSGTGSDCESEAGATFLSSSTLIEDGTCSPALTGDPMLGPLDNYGGPTPTHQVLSGSPLIDAGDQSLCNDLSILAGQTGTPRPIDGDADGTATCDIGAFEFQDLFGPTATVGPLPDITVPNDQGYNVVVNYEDLDSGLDANSFDADDIEISPPLGEIARVNTVAGLFRAEVQYAVFPPGDTWDRANNGTYTVRLVGDQVFDRADPLPNAASSVVLGNFTIAIPEPSEEIFSDGFEG